MFDKNGVELVFINLKRSRRCMLDFRRAHNRCNFKIAKVEVGVQATDTHPEQMGVVEGKAGASS